MFATNFIRLPVTLLLLFTALQVYYYCSKKKIASSSVPVCAEDELYADGGAGTGYCFVNDTTHDLIHRQHFLLLLSKFFMQLSGGHKYLPPRQDPNSPDLYIPLMGLWTYCLLVGVILFLNQSFRPEIVYSTVSMALAAWVTHTFGLKVVLWVLGIPSAAPLLELAAYGGYPFVVACFTMLAHLCLGRRGYHVVWVYGSLAQAVFLVRTMKRVVFQEAVHYSKWLANMPVVRCVDSL